MESLEIIPVKHGSESASASSTLIETSTDKPFVLANTVEGSMEDIKHNHIIPVFVKDNEPLISHSDFIETTLSIVSAAYSGETIMKPSVRLSHPIKGRIPEAKDKPAYQLKEWEKTLYYERMAFIIEVPSITTLIDGNTLSLTIGGVKAYNQDNLYNRKGADEHFKIFIGFQNKVCTNLCVWTDGALMDLKVNSIGQLMGAIRVLIERYNQGYHIFHMQELTNYALTEKQFAQLIGRCKMYPFLPNATKQEIPLLPFRETQMSTVVKDFYKDNSFCRMEDDSINLWRLYNLFTNANKSTYIDQFVERGVNAFSFVYSLKSALQQQNFNWYIN